MKRYFPLIVLLIVLLGGGFVIFRGEWFYWSWNRLLLVSVPMDKADALIVLGGEPLARPQEAARLFHAGVASRIYVTGVGDAGANSRILLKEGVPLPAISVESKASTTYFNALLLKPMIEADHVHTALIVTSPFHTRRALATFRKVMPKVRFGVVDASIEWWKTPQGRSGINRFATIEFLKIAEYWLLYGVSPRLESETESRIDRPKEIKSSSHGLE